MPIEDLIRIRGDITDSAPLQGIGGGTAGDVSVDGGGSSGGSTSVNVTIAANDAAMSASAWSSQSAKITAQNKVLADMKAVYGAKVNDLPQNFSIASFLQSSFCKWLIGGLYDLVLDYLPGNADDYIAKEVIQFGAKLIGYGIEVLKKFYNAGQALCDAMTAENTDLAAWENTRSNYTLRNEVYNSHEMSIQSLSAIISHAETQVKNQTTEGFGDLKQAIDDLKDTLKEHLGSGSLISGIYDYRLGDLPEIVDDLRKDLKGILTVEDSSIFALTKDQIEALRDTLDKRLRDLAYQEGTIEFPSGVRLHPGGKIIEYSG